MGSCRRPRRCIAASTSRWSRRCCCFPRPPRSRWRPDRGIITIAMTQHVIASQFGDEFDVRLRAARPDALVLSLPRRLQWPLRPDVDVLFAVPYSAASRKQPEPSGWPWGVRWVQLVSTGIDNYRSEERRVGKEWRARVV